MRRSSRAWLIVALLVFITVVSAAGWISRHTETSDDLLSPAIQQLVRQSDSFEGERVQVTGDVREFEAGTPDEYYVLEQDGQYRVAIRGLPLDVLRPLTNQQMTVEGEFHFEDGVGRYIDVVAWATPAASPAGESG